MPWQPQTQDITGQLLAQGGSEAARLQLAGSQAMAQGISQAGQGIAAGVGQVGQNYQESKGLDSAADALGPNGNGMVSAEWLDKFHSGNLQAKKAMFGTVTSQWVNQLHQAQTEHLKAETTGLQIENNAANSAATAAQDNLRRAAAFRARLNGGAAPAAAGQPAAQQQAPAQMQPGSPMMTAAQAGLTLNPNATNPFNKPMSAQDIYAFQ